MTPASLSSDDDTRRKTAGHTTSTNAEGGRHPGQMQISNLMFITPPLPLPLMGGESFNVGIGEY